MANEILVVKKLNTFYPLELEKGQKTLEALEVEKTEKEAQETFNQRMSTMDEEYVLSDEDREVIASDIKEMQSEDFEAYSKKMSVLLSAKLRANVKTEEEQADKEAKIETEATAEKVVEEAVEQAEAEADAIPVSSEASEPTLFDKYRSAFSIEQFDTDINN